MHDHSTQLRTYARIAGIGGILVYLGYLFVKVFPALLNIENPNTTADTSILGFLILGYVFAWHREYEGGLILMFISFIAALSYFYQNDLSELPLVLAVCIPLFVSGLLFYLYFYFNTKKTK